DVLCFGLAVLVRVEARSRRHRVDLAVLGVHDDDRPALGVPLLDRFGYLNLRLVLDVLVDGEHDIAAVDRVDGLLDAARYRAPLWIALSQDHPGGSPQDVVVLRFDTGQTRVFHAHEPEYLR